MRKVKYGLVFTLTVLFVLALCIMPACKTTTTETTAAETTAAVTTAAATTAAETTVAETTAAEREPVTIEVWTGATEDHTYYKLMVRAAEIVKEKYNITATIVAKGASNYRELATAAALSQSGPDAMQFWGGMADFITAGRQKLFLPINDILAPEDLKLNAISGFTDPDNGDIYGLPTAINFVCVAFNKELMTQAGIDYASFPLKWTYDEFLAVCAKLKDAGITPFCFANKEGYFADWWPSFMVPTFFDKIEDVIPMYQTKPANKEPFTTFCNNWKDFYTKGYYSEGGDTIPIADAWGQLPNGVGAMAFCSPGIIDIYYEGMKDNVGTIEWPAMGTKELSKANPVFGEGVGITNWTKHPEECLLYIKTLIYEKEIVEGFAKAGNTPVSSSFDMSEFTIDNAATKEYLTKHNQMPTFYEGHGYWSREYSQTTEKFCNMMLKGDITIEQYCKEIDAILK